MGQALRGSRTRDGIALIAMTLDKKVVALSGGIGGAKLALGLYHLLGPERLTVVTNTADDFEHLGLYISPDMDTVMCTLAGVSNKELSN